MSEVSDRVMMRLAEEVMQALWSWCPEVFERNESWDDEAKSHVAAALSSHGLREAVEKIQEALDHCYQEAEGTVITWVCPSSYVVEALTALVGEGEKREPFEPLEEHAL